LCSVDLKHPEGEWAVLLLKAGAIIDPEAEAHFAVIRTMRDITWPHCHDFYELFLVSRGRIWHMVNDRRDRLEAGALVLIRPQDEHWYEKCEDEECELINLAFPPVTLDAVARFLGDGCLPRGLLTGAMPPARQLSQTDLAAVRTRLQALGNLGAGPRRALRTAVRALLADLLVQYFADQPTAPPVMPAWLAGLVATMQQQENFVAGLDRLHALSPASPEHLCRSFRRHLGVTPTDWVNGLRLRYAAYLLTHGDEPVVSVCLQAGFENLSHFYHLFRRAFGVAPARYRKENRRVVVPE
jgi:AraC family transcriptional regulator, dual regulator of chb operon